MAASRRAIAEKLLDLQQKVAPDLLKIDGYKEQLRDLCEAAGESFTEEVEGLGSVEVKAGTKRKFKGIVPAIVAETFLALPESRRKKLIDGELVVMTEEYTNARSPSVTVRL